MKKFLQILLTLLLVITIFSCKKDKDEPEETTVNPADANSLTNVVGLPTGNTRVNGTMPAPTGGVQTPIISAVIPEVLASNGSTAPFLYTYTNAISNLGGFYVQVEGADSYFRVPYTGSQNPTGQISLPLDIPTNVDPGNFCLLFSVYDQNNRVSNRTRVCAQVIRLGTGALQISLSWNTATDQDLHVTDPSGTEIYYLRDTSIATGGKLDRDDIDGFGPENIFWLSNAPEGSYVVQVNDYENSSTPNTCYVTVTSPGKSKSFTVTTQRGSKVNVVTIRKNGTNYDY